MRSPQAAADKDTNHDKFNVQTKNKMSKMAGTILAENSLPDKFEKVKD